MTIHKEQLSIHRKLAIYSLLKSLRLTNSKNFEKKFKKLSDKLYDDLYEQKAAEKWIDLNPGGILNRKKIIILSSKHTAYIAERISCILDTYNFDAPVIYECDASVRNDKQNLYLVICPNIFTSGLPEHYIAYNFEQTISDRWFTHSYISKLDNAISVLDYSLTNIKYLDKKNIAPKRVFYAPVAPTPAKSYDVSQRTTDILFYGDNSCPRRQAILERLSKRLNIKIVNNLFQEEMQRELDNAKIVLNIHYYEGAMLETPRVCEAISHGCLVISETSINDEEYPELQSIVDFVKVNDVEALERRLEYWISNAKELQHKICENQQLLTASSRQFSYYIARVLVYHDLVSFEAFYRNEKDFFDLGEGRICLSLPESIERRHYFESVNKHGFKIFPAIRHKLGWIGCATSYKFLARKAMEENRKELIICEDDVYFPAEYAERAVTAEKYFKSHQPDIFSGFIVDLHPKAEISGICSYDNVEIVSTNKVVSTVYTIFGHAALKLLASWNNQNRDIKTNSIDRYLEHQSGLCVALAYPFLVGHNEDMISTLSNKQNGALYDKMLKQSKQTIESKLRAYRKSKK